MARRNAQIQESIPSSPDSFIHRSFSRDLQPGEPLASDAPRPPLPPADPSSPPTLGIAAAPAEDPPEVSRQVLSVALEIPLASVPGGYTSRHVDVNKLTPDEQRGLAMLSAGLQASEAHLPNGKLVGDSKPLAIRWLLLQIVSLESAARDR